MLMVSTAAGAADRIAFVSLADVQVTDPFLAPRLETNRRVTIPHNLQMCRRTGVIDNFAWAAGRKDGPRVGLLNWDNFLYKTIEAASYSLMTCYDAALDHELDDIIRTIAGAQETDGYLNTYKMWRHRQNPQAHPYWGNLRGDLELYTAGHLFEAAAAHYRATGKRTFLDVAVKNANLIADLFGPGKNMGVPGHEEIETALVRLFEVTQDEKYLRLSQFFVDQRGNAQGHELYGAHHQDHELFVDQPEAVGQAPRATYLYSGAADIAYYLKRPDYIRALDRLWKDVTYRKMYITGGIGSKHSNEGFGPAYDLPNRTAYTEICAAVSFPMWAVRMFKLHGDAKYIDIAERTLYNNLLAGVSLSGDRYFYACPPESDGKYKFNLGWCPRDADVPYKEPSATRKEWFPCACCPPNLARYLPQIPGFIYAKRGDDLYVNLFVASRSTVNQDSGPVIIRQQTRYPWEGHVRIEFELETPRTFTAHVRIPGWARNEPAPSDLYRFQNQSERAPELNINGRPVALRLEQGFVPITRAWRTGDTIELLLPMPIRRIISHSLVKDNIGKVALQRGPIVYCAEGVDNQGKALNILVPDDAPLYPVYRQDFLGGVTVITGQAFALHERDNRMVQRKLAFQAIPYCVWSNRGANEMAVWLWRDIDKATLN